MRHYYSDQQIRDAEAPLLAALPDGALMRRAAWPLAVAIAGELHRRTGAVAGRRVCAVVGSGDNGGDALWAATFLRRRGAAADAVLLDPARAHKGAAANEQNMCGVDVLTGAVSGPAVRPVLTVTFGGLKPVHALADCGRVELIDIGLELPPTGLLGFDAAEVAARWPVPGARDDKYSQGVTGVLAGSSAYPGAAILCSGAAVATHSGMVRYVGSAAAQVVSHWPEVVAAPGFAEAGRVQAWVIGPGLGTGHSESALLREVLATDLPVIVDADALTLLARHPGLVRSRTAPTVLTPHAGEYERLAGRPPGDDRVGAARALAADLGATVLLKGNVTVIADPAGPTYLNPAGQAWAATAGSGDVLSGVIGALLSAGLPAAEAAAAAAFVHARAADLSARDPGPASVPTSASRILAHLRSALAEIL